MLDFNPKYPKNPQNLGEKIRIARIGQDLYKKAKESYKWRCQVVHGMKLHKLEREKSNLVLYNKDFLNKLIFS